MTPRQIAEAICNHMRVVYSADIKYETAQAGFEDVLTFTIASYDRYGTNTGIIKKALADLMWQAQLQIARQITYKLSFWSEA